MTRNIRPIRIEGNIAYVTLTQGYEAVIDASDVSIVEKYNWFAHINPNTVYARCSDCSGQKPKKFRMHRMIIQAPDGLEVDHIDGDGLNNTRANLRLATKAQNAHNSRMRVNNTSGFKGVYWAKRNKKWGAQIKLNGRTKHLGYFTEPEDAHAAYVAASAKMHGEFGRAAYV